MSSKIITLELTQELHDINIVRDKTPDFTSKDEGKTQENDNPGLKMSEDISKNNDGCSKEVSSLSPLSPNPAVPSNQLYKLLDQK